MVVKNTFNYQNCRRNGVGKKGVIEMSMIQKTWNVWSGLFEWMPYGDPYMAFATLIVLIAVVAKLTVGGETSGY